MTEKPIGHAAGDRDEDNDGDGGPLALFKDAMKSKKTEEQSLTRLGYYFNFLNIPGGYDLKNQTNNFVDQVAANPNPKFAHDCLNNFARNLKDRFEKKELRGSGTVRNYLYAVKTFYEVNDIEFDWKKIKRGLPTANYIAHDIIPTIEQIRKLITNSDIRIKVVVLIMISSGIRVGAFDYLKLKHVIPIKNEKEEIIAAKLVVYAGEPDEHFTFITPEAYHALQEYVDFRELHHEKTTGESWLLRDKFLTTTDRHAANKSMATKPRKLEVESIKKLIQRAWEVQGVREPLKEGEHRHEFKTTHSFRKYYETNMRIARIDPLNVKRLMGQKVGIEDNYYRPWEETLQDEYLKAVDFLTINTERKERNQLRKEVVELKEERKNDNYVIMGKLAEKEKETEITKKQLENIQKQIEELKAHAYESQRQEAMKLDFARNRDLWRIYHWDCDHPPMKGLHKEGEEEVTVMEGDEKEIKEIMEWAKAHKKYQEDLAAWGKEKKEEDNLHA